MHHEHISRTVTYKMIIYNETSGEARQKMSVHCIACGIACVSDILLFLRRCEYFGGIKSFYFKLETTFATTLIFKRFPLSAWSLFNPMQKISEIIKYQTDFAHLNLPCTIVKIFICILVFHLALLTYFDCNSSTSVFIHILATNIRFAIYIALLIQDDEWFSCKN